MEVQKFETIQFQSSAYLLKQRIKKYFFYYYLIHLVQGIRVECVKIPLHAQLLKNQEGNGQHFHALATDLLAIRTAPGVRLVGSDETLVQPPQYLSSG